MSESEGFLGRWSRRKREATVTPAPRPEPPAAAPPAEAQPAIDPARGRPATGGSGGGAGGDDGGGTSATTPRRRGSGQGRASRCTTTTTVGSMTDTSVAVTKTAGGVRGVQRLVSATVSRPNAMAQTKT